MEQVVVFRRISRVLRWLVALAVILSWPVPASAEASHTPRAGSAERKAVCDAMRDFVKAYRAPRGILFMVDQMRVMGRYCYFEGYAVYEDGSAVPETILPDVVYQVFLKKSDKGWRVLLDLTRTDVPSDAEARELRRAFPPEIPRQIIPPFWRELLRL